MALQRHVTFQSQSSICFIILLIGLFCIGIAFEAEGQEGKDYSKLFSRAQASGSVRIIVKLDTPFAPEGTLSTPEVLGQKDRISKIQDKILRALSKYTVKGAKRFKHIPYLAMEADSTALSLLAGDPEVISIEEDVPIPLALNDSVPLINADGAWTSGYSGSGWTVAILDTGVDKTHTFFSGGKVVSEACFSTTSVSSITLCPNGRESQTGSGAGVNCSTSIDGCAHGTHVAGIAAGKSAAINGVAKDANIIAIQIFSRFNNAADCSPAPAPCIFTYTSDQILALEHVYSLRITYNIASVNMSVGGGAYPFYCDADNSSTKAIIDNLRSAGIATVIAAGNDGFCGFMRAPACISTAVSVGATTKADQKAGYNNYASILSLFAPGDLIYSSVPGGWGFMSGTSMATPHVTGAWAVLKQKSPSASVSDILSALQTTGVSIADACSGSGNYPQRRIDVSGALNALVCTNSISPTSRSFSSSGGTGSINVTGSCAWTATSNDPWIVITSGSSGTGTGTVSYSVSTNATGQSRTGTITVAGQTFTVRQAAAAFADVNAGYWAYPFIYRIFFEGITGGCDNGNFCPDNPVTRAQMAVFLLTAMGEQPVAACTGTFYDVNANTIGEPFCKFIEKFATLGITGGCGNGNFCPTDPVTRGQMAVFMTTALHQGPAASCNGTFNDVNPGSGDLFCRYIEKFATLGITGGCGNGNYCPNDPVTRAQMAVFLTMGFLQ